MRPSLRQRAPLLRSILSGVAATLLLFGLADLLARLIGPTSAPLLVLGQAIIPFTPTSVIKPVIALFGSNDKIVLVATVGIGALVLGALIGWLGAKRPRAALIAFGLAGLVPALAVLTRSGAGPVDVVPTLAGLIAGLVVLWAGLRLGGAGATTGTVAVKRPTQDGSSLEGPVTDTPPDRATPADPGAGSASTETAPTPTHLLSQSASPTPASASRRRFFALTGAAAAIGAIGLATGQSLVALDRKSVV